MTDPTRSYRVAVTIDGQRAMRVVKWGHGWPRLRPEWRWANESDAHHAEVRAVIEASTAAKRARSRGGA